MTPEERVRTSRAVSRMKQWLMQVITLRHPELESFHDMLHRRTPVALVTPALLTVNITIFVLMLWGAHPLSDPNTLVEWGGNVGPRTANGEWWRIFTALFVHASWLHLLANVVGLLQLGLMLEHMGKNEDAIEQFKQIYEVDIGYRDVAAKVDAYYSAQ